MNKGIKILRKSISLTLILLLSYSFNYGNNIQISNLEINGQNNSFKFKLIQFDISWENSWKITSGPNNWDAAWVFVKFKRKSDNTWHHATLHYENGTGSDDGHTEPLNCNIASSNDLGNGAVGVFIHRTDAGQSTVFFDNVKLRWDYGKDGLGDDDNVQLSVMGIEMVYVPQGSFYIGTGGGETASFFTHPDANVPFYISNEDSIDIGTTNGFLKYAATSNSGDGLGPIPDFFPKGFNAFYCMKYEMTQKQYVDFLNKLTYDQQASRTAVPPSSNPGTNAMTGGTNSNSRNGIDIMISGIANNIPAIYANNLDNDATFNESNDGQFIACNHISWADIAAYLDWAGLRPMTELEYEKACRGDQFPVKNEYAWANTTMVGGNTINQSGTNAETCQAGANCARDGLLGGPVRNGAFANSSSTRGQSGSTYYGIMEMTGNLWEKPIAVGRPEGRAFDGSHGDGQLDFIGNHNVINWPINNAFGVGFRGGSWDDDTNRTKVSDRSFAATIQGGRTNLHGCRGVRTAPPSL